jgi:CRISPR-associated endonuclease Csn1
MEKKDYYIGLDMGTESIGWAVTDKDYNLLKARGRDMWGSFLFEEAKTAEERRKNRNSRRRLARVHYRLMLLQMLFKEEIEKKDQTFFLRLNDSKLMEDDKDKNIKTKYVLFGDLKYTDKEYYKKFPTIFHLRDYLTKNKTEDIRFIYLALHHIIKNRGHFLFEGQEFNFSENEIVRNIFSEINTLLSEQDSKAFSFEKLEEALDVIKDSKVNKKDKQKKLKTLFVSDNDIRLNAIICAITGGTVKIKDLFMLDEDLEGVSKFSFESSDFIEKTFPEIENTVGVDNAELILKIKAIYDWSVLCNILKGKKYISEAKIEIYNKHKYDLYKLKNYIRKNMPEKYSYVFRYKKGINNYAAYVGMDKQKGFSKCLKEDFYAFLKNTLKITETSILSEIESGSFMPKQISNANGVIPYQVNLAELKAILSIAEQSFSFLKERENGITVSEKIIALMTFRVPYYVGPLNTSNKKFAWVVKRDGQERTKITPWNFEDIIDRDASEEAFITRMTSKCTYLPTEDVLPASSFLYSEFIFLNELNNLKINGEKNENVRQIIFEYAKSHKRLTLNNIYKLLIKEGVLTTDSKKENVFSGIDGDFKMSLSSYIDFKNIIGEKVDSEQEMCEEIIKWITLVSDKNRLVARIKNKYGRILSDEEINRIKSMNYSQWGKLSKALLTDIKRVDQETGELASIIQAMRNTENNFMQLLSYKYDYIKEIQNYNSQFSSSRIVTYKTIEDLYCSPSVKRSIWRSICLIKEIIKIEDSAPIKIFIEMARGSKENQKGKRTLSRQQQLIDLYRNIKDEKHDWISEINETEAGKFNSDKVILYYRQMGRCMYTGEPITFSSLFDTNVYDIDHIYPQSKIKDDSLDNRVLVTKESNLIKIDIYPISVDVRNKMRSFWNILHSNHLISDEKYYRLTRNSQLTQDELADFINRQLVETRQSTKAVAEIFKTMLPDTEIVYAKAKNADDFKNTNGIIKVRELNNLHHAKDAYINIVVGNIYNTKFGHNAAIYFKNNNLKKFDLRKLYSQEVKGAWIPSEKDRILAIAKKNTCIINRFTNEGTGMLFNATIKTAGANDKLIPLKSKGAISNTLKYGGYDSATTAYFMLVKCKGKKGEQLLSLECIPIYLDRILNIDTQKLIDFCIEKLELSEPEILISKIKLNTLFNIDGSYAYIRGRTGKQLIWCNANELFIDEENIKYLKKITGYFDSMKKLNKKEMPISEKYDGITKQQNNRLYLVLKDKLSSDIYKGLSIANQSKFLEEKKSVFEELSIENQCRVLIEVLHFMQCNSVTSDVSLIGGGNNAGKILTSKFIHDKDIKMIYSSPTGYYKQIIDIKKYL